MEQTGPAHPSVHEPHSTAVPIMIVAGEASGDRHGAALAQALRRVDSRFTYDLFGSGGEEMRRAGVETMVDAREVAIIGVPEIARAFGKLYRAYRKLLAAARSRRPEVVVLIDWPDFNMRLARKLRRDGFKVVYYISPQVWAWRKYRVRALRRDVDRMLVILPFEEAFYQDAGLDVSYVGHPLTESVRPSISRDEFCRRHGLDAARSIIALLPGSRHKEIHYHLPVMLDAANRLRNVPVSLKHLQSEGLLSERQGSTTTSGLQFTKPTSGTETGTMPQFIVPLASTIRREEVEGRIEAARQNDIGDGHRRQSPLSITIIEQDTYNSLAYSQFAIVASGTATLEAALSGTPMVIIYRGSGVNWRIIRPLIRLDTFGLVNLIAGKRVVPELMQREVTGENIAREVIGLLSDSVRLGRMHNDLERVKELLVTGEVSASSVAAREVLRVIGLEKF